MKCHVLALEETKKTLAECFQEQRHFCLIFIPFLIKISIPTRAVWCDAQSKV